MRPRLKAEMTQMIKDHPLDQRSYAIGLAAGFGIGTMYPDEMMTSDEAWDIVEDLRLKQGAFAEVKV